MVNNLYKLSETIRMKCQNQFLEKKKSTAILMYLYDIIP